MPFKDHREFMRALKKTGDLVEIDREVDWDCEVGAIGRRNYEKGGPCLHFTNIKDYPGGYTILNGSTGTWRRVAICLGLEPQTPVRDIYRHYEERLKVPIEPVTVGREAAPCKENVQMGDEVDLYTFPAPMIHDGDGGRYIGTWDLVVTSTPDGTWQNWGMYRFMIHNRRWLAGWPQTTSQLAMKLRQYYMPRNQAMPVAVVIGADPNSHLAATAPFRPGESEALYAGGLNGAPIELVRCETSDLLVPANAEIVIEGEVPLDQTAPDGPFGEYPGYRSGTMAEGLALRVKAITYRNDPILTMIALGVPIDDSSIAASLTAGVAMKRGLLRRKIPITDVYVPPDGVTHLIVVGVRERGAETARRILEYFTARRVMVSKIIVVEEDVDPFNMGQVLHAFASKCHPGRGIHVEHYEGRANSLSPFYGPAERAVLKGASVAFDCTWPADWDPEIIPVRASFQDMYPQEIKDRVIKNWNDYGLKESREASDAKTGPYLERSQP
ncbi:MAG: UbiD family decarboxylase [Deltaproteobacteria bacterium]|nr:UbiD family decarboxylase [Deltaproteobacteria bacterium]MBW2120425.1 UbiD family decarboxylase [Deltaproteobacteria bacterium]